MAGDEFAVWLSVDRQASALVLAEQLRAVLDEPFMIGGLEHFTSASIGVVVADGGSTADGLIAEADTAMVTAKSAGGNGYAVFDATLRERMTERTQALRDLNRAIQHREIDLDVQPIIDLADGTRSYEVLARWNHPTRGRLSPAAFIGLAEESGLIGRLGSQILELGASHAAALDARVSVNVSVRQFNRSLTQQVASLIERFHLAPGQLIIEITESAVIDNAQAQSILGGLRKVGADIWIDDFGTGYSSLSRLTALTVDGLKLPREFIEDLDSPQGWGIAAAIVGIARALDISVIAEGVETKHQLAQLHRLGCDAAQGYLLGRPRPFLQEHAAMLAGDDELIGHARARALIEAAAPAVPALHAELARPTAEPTRPSSAAAGLRASSEHDGYAADLLWDHLPLGLLVVDREGTIRLANDRASAMAGRDHIDLVGRTLFEFVPPEDTEFIIETLARGTDFASKLLGPFRLRYKHRDGTLHTSEHWAFESPNELGFEGYVVTVAHEAAGDVLAAAFREIATGAALDTSLQTVARALSAHPIEADGAVLRIDDGHITAVLGAWPYDSPNALRDADAPWVIAMRDGDDTSMSVNELPAHLRDRAVACGHSSVWVRAVDQAGHRRAVIVAWHPDHDQPSPNQERHLDEAVAAVALAFGQDDHRRHLRHAALHDHLTGAGNRAKLELDAATMHASFAVFVDLDDFKMVNDRFGHAVGDMVLREAADRLVDVVVDRARVYRLGGDEFALLFEARPERADDSDDIDAAADEILGALHLPYRITDGCEVVVGASVGTACAGNGERADHLLSRADEALLWAKRDGKARHQRAIDVVAI